MKEQNIRIVLALDNMKEERMLSLAEELVDLVDLYKVNDAVDRYGVAIIKKLRRIKPVFADPKIHDTPRTTINRMNAFVDAGAAFVTVHADYSCLEAARSIDLGETEIVAVTELTSEHEDKHTQKKVDEKASNARFCSCKYITCAGKEAKAVRTYGANRHLYPFIPGVRPSWVPPSPGQHRVTDPRDAVMMLAKDFGLILGTSVTDAESYGMTPRSALLKIRRQIRALL